MFDITAEKKRADKSEVTVLTINDWWWWKIRKLLQNAGLGDIRIKESLSDNREFLNS